ncbi:ArsR/SmtB family transcription factor [Limisphaera sp. VF-2]|jgi:DNA-binding transcriptional ArsR family regulator|uniref:ArsR/SmtB family transcription factor n=1 Tax=Limisphaera sp. VF-2 TaxID=3400418 RepID=UPI00176E028F
MERSPVSSHLREQARILKALAHPGRLRILQELAEGERCVCDLAALLGVRVPTASRHLALLREAGIVEDEKRGAQVFYRLRTPCVLNFFECVAAVQESREETRRRARKRNRNSGSVRGRA